MDEYKHYIRTDTNGIIIKGFTDAFEQMQEGDLLLSGQDGRHFKIQLSNERGQFVYKLVNGQMVDRTQDADYLLLMAKQSKLAEVNSAADVALQTFQSAALGTPHTYLSGTNDMILLAAEYGFLKGDDYDGKDVIWYTMEAGNVTHTKAQFIQAYLDGRAYISSTKYRRATLEYQINTATTAEQVNPIVW